MASNGLNICFIGHFTAGGTERATFLVANGLCNKYNIHIINTCNDNPTFELNERVGFDYLKSGNVITRILALKQYLRLKNIDILVSVEAMLGIITVPATKMAHCKHVVWEHANYYQTQGSRWIQIIRQLELISANAYVVLTQKDLGNFQEHFKINTKLKQIYNIGLAQTNTIYSIDSKTIISVGHIRKIKNFIVIPDIARVVFDKHPDWRWKIYGEPIGLEYELIKQKIEEYNLQDNVIFAGRNNEMNKVYQTASMLVMTSLQEGLSMVLLEAKSNKLPLVSFDIQTGPSEIIRDRVNGFLIQAFDVEDMAEKISSLIESEKMRKEFSEKSTIDLELFDKDSICKKWIQLFDDVMCL